MTHDILAVVQDVVTSPWIYLVVYLLAALDGFLPAVPSETAVITAGVYAAATGAPSVPLVIAVAALGAFTGDHVSYLIGRGAGRRLLARLAPGSRRRAPFDWAGRALGERGGLVLVVARYVPGGRTAVTVTMGTTGYPLRSFTRYAAVAAVTWGGYGTLVGYLGGVAFESNPLYGVAVGIGFALAVAALVELVRHLRHRHSEEVGAQEQCEVSRSRRPGRPRTPRSRPAPCSAPPGG